MYDSAHLIPSRRTFPAHSAACAAFYVVCLTISFKNHVISYNLLYLSGEVALTILQSFLVLRAKRKIICDYLRF